MSLDDEPRQFDYDGSLVARCQQLATGEVVAEFNIRDWRPGEIAMCLWNAAEEIKRLRALLVTVEHGAIERCAAKAWEVCSRDVYVKQAGLEKICAAEIRRLKS